MRPWGYWERACVCTCVVGRGKVVRGEMGGWVGRWVDGSMNEYEELMNTQSD